MAGAAAVAAVLITINGQEVPVFYPTNPLGPEHVEFILREPKVAKYFNEITTDIVVRTVTIYKEIMFGKRLGFLFMQLETLDRRSGKGIPGVVFLRGDAAACLLLLKNKETRALYMALVKQARVPAGKKVFEAPAGMLDDNTENPTLTVAKEIAEETGTVVKSTGVKTDDPMEQVHYLESLGVPIQLSPGGTQEQIFNFWYMVEMTTAEIAALHGKRIVNEEEVALASGAGTASGLNASGADASKGALATVKTAEVIEVIVQEFTLKNVLLTGDAKLICATAALMGKYPGFVPL